MNDKDNYGGHQKLLKVAVLHWVLVNLLLLVYQSQTWINLRRSIQYKAQLHGSFVMVQVTSVFPSWENTKIRLSTIDKWCESVPCMNQFVLIMHKSWKLAQRPRQDFPLDQIYCCQRGSSLSTFPVVFSLLTC